MTLRTCLLLLLAACALVAARPVGAQQIDSPYRFVDESQAGGAFVGYVITDAGALELGPESGPALGLRYAIRINGPFTLEAEAMLFPTSRTAFRLEPPADTLAPDQDSVRVPAGDADLTLAVLQAGLRFNVTGPRTWRNLMPYLIVGGGAAIDVSGDADVERDIDAPQRFDFGTTFAGQIGAGVEWFVLPRLGVRADFRDVFWKLKTPEAFLTASTPSEEWVQNFVLSGGVSYHF